jgi:hypothetical protein
VSNIPPQNYSSTVEAIYAQLNQRDIEQFSAGYQRWHLQQQIAAIQTQLDSLRQQIVENTERMQAVHPTAIALAALARLQANGVSDIELLDQMLEQGEMWLDRTMQRLDYCEQLDDFIRDDYTQWCRHALEGAYDWIDSIQEGSLSSSPPVSVGVEEAQAEATEELFLRKLSSDEEEKEEHDEDGAVMLEMEITLKRPAITMAHAEDSVSPVEDIPSEIEVTCIAEETIPVLEEAFAGDVIDIAGEVAPPLSAGAINLAPTDGEASSSEGEQIGMQEYMAFEESLSVEDSATPDVEEPVIQEYVMPEESFSVESSSIADSEELDGQTLVEVAPITKDPASALPELPLQSEEFVPSEAQLLASQADDVMNEQAESIEPSQTMVTQPARRHNFLVRLLAKLFGK